jgi:probable O-glycosylation ligase (exosortase A-associated)
MLGSAVYIAYELNFYYLVYRWMMLQQRGYGGLDNNGAAMILAMAIPLAYFAWEATVRWWRWVFIAMIPVIGHAILLSYSRGAMLALMPTAILMWWRSRNKAFLGLAYVAGVALLVATTSKEIGERFASTFNSAYAEQQGQRFATWSIAFRMTNDRPVFGWGIRVSPSFTYTQYGADVPNRAIHSQYLQTAADSGWPALGLYLALLGSVFYGLWQTRKALRPFNDPETLKVKSLASGLECSLLLFCIGAAFLSLEHFEMPYIVILLAVQLHAITQAVTARLNPTPSGLPPLTLPYPYPAAQRPVAVSS